MSPAQILFIIIVAWLTFAVAVTHYGYERDLPLLPLLICSLTLTPAVVLLAIVVAEHIGRRLEGGTVPEATRRRGRAQTGG